MNRNNGSLCFVLIFVGVISLGGCRPRESTRPAVMERAGEQAPSKTQGPSKPPGEKQASSELKVVCWNVLYGFNHGNGIEAGQQWLNEQQPDVVALQELNGNNEVSFAKIAGGWKHPHAAILKENGFPVGLTSTAPIEVVERAVEGYHHGFLHAKTHGIHFFVVHFWPGNEHEGRNILSKIQKLLDEQQRVIVLGDFNSHSPKDEAFLKSKEGVEPSFEVVEMFESQGFVDLVGKHHASSRFSAPSPITIPRWSKDMEEVESKRQRIDFIFAGPTLAKFSTGGTIVVNQQIESVSDHYPVVGEFDLAR